MNRTKADAIPEQALAWIEAGKPAALATVIRTWGSAPRPVGAQLAISAEAELMGSVSGGCVEGAVTAEAIEAIEEGRPRILSYGVSDDDAFAVGLACGGEIRILVEPVGAGQGLPSALLRDLVGARERREAAALITDLSDWSRQLVGPDAAPEAFQRDRSGFLDAAEQRFITVHNPPLRMAVIGAVHIAQALAPMARIAGYDVTVIDPRGAFAAEHRFPGETVREEWPDEALDAFSPDARSAVVCLTHDPKLDDAALMRALVSEAFYVGALGSPRTHAKRAARLSEKGLEPAALTRLHAPIGLDIGARSPAEIAVAILAEATARLRGAAIAETRASQ